MKDFKDKIYHLKIGNILSIKKTIVTYYRKKIIQQLDTYCNVLL